MTILTGWLILVAGGAAMERFLWGEAGNAVRGEVKVKALLRGGYDARQAR